MASRHGSPWGAVSGRGKIWNQRPGLALEINIVEAGSTRPAPSVWQRRADWRRRGLPRGHPERPAGEAGVRRAGPRAAAAQHGRARRLGSRMIIFPFAALAPAYTAIRESLARVKHTAGTGPAPDLPPQAAI
ncbi:uncharacterized protein MAM_01504 [Metarhizium album ARSEF 1941]|uniref:Uncharacterized protein n=1 Tax=Metarhizium album (strain ARSEF 1941) TaxID=1081103 RepID=A0A0B2X5Z9_METAS|nr:uncharacterized protein MAM_01504 [Metarhizium album ARSEF 1941]KHO00726.1 hypothetical protein MAM_01504 [Metarhizium album ARSEF 1941]